MTTCEHEREPFGSAMCVHLRTCREPWIKYVKWYIESGLDTHLLCIPCAEKRAQSIPVEVGNVCQECFEYQTGEICVLDRVGGKPAIKTRSEPFNSALEETPLPTELGTIADIAPIDNSRQSLWLLLADDGGIFRFDAKSIEFVQVARSDVIKEPPHKSESWPALRQRLHVSSRGEFVAVVNDYGRYGQVIDLQSGKVTLMIDGGDYHPETVPLSFAFADFGTRVVAIHRTEWNRLDFSDAASGKLLSDRGPTSYNSGEEQPEHYLDYFHGGLYLNPNGTRIIDDGWIWHPVGSPVTWSLDYWFSKNVWESEDGSTRKDVCARDYYWDRGVAWLDESKVALSGIGDGDSTMIDGARVFDVTASGQAGALWRSDLHWAKEVMAFPGPSGKFFSDGNSLFSSNESGLSRWSTDDGAQTGYMQDFHPTHHHRGAGELVQLKDGVLFRWKIEIADR